MPYTAASLLRHLSRLSVVLVGDRAGSGGWSVAREVSSGFPSSRPRRGKPLGRSFVIAFVVTGNNISQVFLASGVIPIVKSCPSSGGPQSQSWISSAMLFPLQHVSPYHRVPSPRPWAFPVLPGKRLLKKQRVNYKGISSGQPPLLPGGDAEWNSP